MLNYGRLKQMKYDSNNYSKDDKYIDIFKEIIFYCKIQRINYVYIIIKYLLS